MLEAVTFHREIRTGSSLPLIVSHDDGHRYVMKARGSGDGALGSIVDWVALRLGRRLGIPALSPLLIQVKPGFEQQAGDPEIRDLLGESHGKNLATRWIEDARTAVAADFDRLDLETRRDVFLFDLLLLNVDRTEKNPNAIVGPGGFRCLDFSAAMALRRLFSDEREATPRMLKEIRRNPLYEPGIDSEPFIDRLGTISKGDLVEAVSGLPLKWRTTVAPRISPKRFNRSLVALLGELLGNTASLQRRLRALLAIPLETDDQRRRRSEANRSAFKRRFKS